MSRCLCLLVVLLLTCTPADDGVVVVHARRDAVPIALSMPVTSGNSPGGRMGTTVVVCDGEAMASGVSGEVWGNGNLVTLPDAPQATVLSCRDTMMGHEYLAGGSSGLFSFLPSDTTWSLVNPGGVQSIDRRPSDSTLLVAQAQSIDLFGRTMGLVNLSAKAVRWSGDGNFFAAVTASRVHLFTFTAGNQTASSRAEFDAPVGRMFGNSVAVGQFNPRAGLEVAVTLDQGGVAVYNPNDTAPLYVFSTGSSVATDENWLGTLDSLLVGEPENELVRRWVGDAAVEDWYLDGGGPTEFGYAIAINELTGETFVGAPGHDFDTGAVYSIATPTPMPLGIPLGCDVQLPCFPPSGTPGRCSVGACVGGVICEPTPNTCPLGWSCTVNSDVCEPDALDGGFPDAGAEDAGEPDDAGARDAGLVKDGGLQDGGLQDGSKPFELVSHFDAVACTGCASVTGLDAFLLAACAWLLSRRARRRTNTS